MDVCYKLSATALLTCRNVLCSVRNDGIERCKQALQVQVCTYLARWEYLIVLEYRRGSNINTRTIPASISITVIHVLVPTPARSKTKCIILSTWAYYHTK